MSLGLGTRKAAETVDRVDELDDQIRRAEAEHAKRLAHVELIERDLAETVRQRRVLETRRDTLGDADPAALDRKITTTIARETALRVKLAEANEAVQGTPALLEQLRAEKSAARVDQMNAERAACRQVVIDVVSEINELAPMFDHIAQLQRRFISARDREDELRRSSVVGPDGPAPSVIAEGVWCGPDCSAAAAGIQNNRALLSQFRS